MQSEEKQKSLYIMKKMLSPLDFVGVN